MKKLVGILLAVLMIAAFVPYSAFAAPPSAADSLIEDDTPTDKWMEGDRSLQDIFDNAPQKTKSAPAQKSGDSTKNDDTTKSDNTTKSDRATKTDSGAKSGTADKSGSSSRSEWAEGKIKLVFRWIKPDTYRNTMQYPTGSSVGWLYMPNFGNGAATLLDSDGKVVGSFTEQSEHVFEGLKAGTYTIRLTILDRGIFHIFESAVNSGPIPHLLTEYESKVVVDKGNDKEIPRWVALEYKAYGFKTTTDIGAFKGNSKEKVYYEGKNWSLKNTDPSTSATNPTLNTHNGIYYGDSANQYTGMNDLEIPTLNDEEKAKGYTFAGWQLVGDDSGKIYSTDKALAYVVKSNVEFKAVWNYPSHTVTFSTNTDYGEIEGKDSKSYHFDFNNGHITEIPKVTPKEGYEFVGWFTDLTVNVVPDSWIKAVDVNKDLNFYAKYKKKTSTNTVKYLPGTAGTLTGRDSLVVKTGSFIPTIPTVTANEGKTFTGYWKVVAVSKETEDIVVGDILNEVQISRLQIDYDVNFEAIYEDENTDKPEKKSAYEPTDDSGNSGSSGTPGNSEASDASATDGTSGAESSSQSGGKGSPQTSDSNDVALWALGVAVSLGGMFFVFSKRKAEKE